MIGPRKRPASRSLTAPSLLIGLLVLTVGCAAHRSDPPDEPLERSSSTNAVTRGVFADPESAALAAFRELRESMRQTDERHLHVGAIVRVEGGYAWRPPLRSAYTGRPVVRLKMERRQVATYIVHPKTGEPAFDRANGVITRAERRLVDETDPLHRPIFVLIPNGRVLAYAQGERVVELADLRGWRAPEVGRLVDVIAYEPTVD